MSEFPALVNLRKNSHLVMGLTFFICLMSLLAFAIVKINAWLEDEQQAPVQDIVVSGELIFIDVKNIEMLIKRTQPGSFFELDVNQTHQTVEAMPWVYRASVRKRWPSGLEIFVVEQQPSAVWNGDMLLNQYGDAFDAQISSDELNSKMTLPNLYGPGGSEQTALQGYRNMQSLLETSNLFIVEMFLSERLLPLISQQDRQVDYVDLRYDTGLAVGWKTFVKAA
jgi:cell division protein FtsQ